MEGSCSRFNLCDSFKKIGCAGCGFQHFEKILRSNEGNSALEFLADEYFPSCAKDRKGQGGRINLDKPIEKLFQTRIPELKKVCPKDMNIKLSIDQKDVDFEIKCDAAFQADGKYIFLEVKGYGDNTNDILSAITAAQLLKEVPKYKDALYYYIGISSSKHDTGLKRIHFLASERTKISPYVKWAENKGLIKFFGIVDIENLLNEVKNVASGNF